MKKNEFDFFGTFISARIKTYKDANSIDRDYDLWLDPIPVGQPGAEFDKTIPSVLSYVQDVTVEIDLSLNSKVSITLTPPFDEGIQLINSPIVQWGLGQLFVTIGYSTGSGQIRTFDFGGLMQKPDVKIGTDVAITLIARGVGYSLNLSSSIDGRSWPGGYTPALAVFEVLRKYNTGSSGLTLDDLYSDFSAAQRSGGHPFFRPLVHTTDNATPPDAPESPESPIAAKPGKGPTAPARPPLPTSPQPLVNSRQVVTSTGVVYVEDRLGTYILPDNLVVIAPDSVIPVSVRDRGAIGPFGFIADDPYPHNTRSVFVDIQQSVKNDWWFVRDMCDAYHVNMLVIDQQVRILNPDNSKARPPQMEFVLKGTIDSQVDRYPVLDFSSSSSVQWIQGFPKLKQSDHDDNGNVINHIITDETEKPTRTGPNVFDPSAKSPHSSGVQDGAGNMPGNPQTQMRELAKAEFKNLNDKAGIEAEVTSVGVPHLLPGRTVRLSGLGPLFDQPFWVKSVRHQIGVGGFTTHWSGLITGFPGGMQTTKKLASGQVSPDQFPEDSAGFVRMESKDAKPGAAGSLRPALDTGVGPIK